MNVDHFSGMFPIGQLFFQAHLFVSLLQGTINLVLKMIHPHVIKPQAM